MYKTYKDTLYKKGLIKKSHESASWEVLPSHCRVSSSFWRKEKKNILPAPRIQNYILGFEIDCASRLLKLGDDMKRSMVKKKRDLHASRYFMYYHFGFYTCNVGKQISVFNFLTWLTLILQTYSFLVISWTKNAVDEIWTFD